LALERALAVYDPETEQAQRLRSHVAADRALGNRKTRRLISPYESTTIKLLQLLDDPTRQRGVGMKVQLNGRESVKLLLDTGASGVSLSPKAAEKAGLESLGGERSQAHGIGDGKASDSTRYLAAELRAGDLVLADVPIEVFRAAKQVDFDGIIGADVFSRFLVTIDFVHTRMLLEPHPDQQRNHADVIDDSYDADNPLPGLFRVFRFGAHLAIPTRVNDGMSKLFLVDSGSSSNLIDTETAKEATKVYGDDRIAVRGIQGSVNKISRAERISLVFAGFRQDNPDLLSISLEKTGDSLGAGLGGILGWPVLRQMKLTIDYRNGAVRLEHLKGDAR